MSSRPREPSSAIARPHWRADPNSKRNPSRAGDMPSDSFDSVVLDVRGMWCTSCANALEGVLRRHAGVLEAKVNLASQSALVQWDPAVTSLRDLLAGTARLGYECVPDGESHDRTAHFAKITGDLSLRLVVALF